MCIKCAIKKLQGLYLCQNIIWSLEEKYEKTWHFYHEFPAATGRLDSGHYLIALCSVYYYCYYKVLD